MFDFAADVLAGDSWQTQIEHERGRRGSAEFFQAIAPIGGYVNSVSLGFKETSQSFLDSPVVLNYEYSFHTR